MHLVPTFGTTTPVIPEGTAKLVEFLKSDFRSLFPTQKKHWERTLRTSRILEAPVMVHVIKSRPELSSKFGIISHIEYQIQIARLEIRQGSSFRTPRLLR
ncbi:hypothetical protein TNCV_2517131 [Trichonephila clavipes]|nr:hypothetical protein TNCV_2517131 [Trichonephila clavipes]